MLNEISQAQKTSTKKSHLCYLTVQITLKLREQRLPEAGAQGTGERVRKGQSAGTKLQADGNQQCCCTVQ